MKLWLPSVLRFEWRLLTCFIKSKQCLCHRLKINTKVSDHSVVVYSAIILQMERSAGTQRSLNCNQAVITVAEGYRHTYRWAHTRTQTPTYRREMHFHQYMPNFSLVPYPAARNWYDFTECIFFSTKGIYGLRCLPAKN